MKLPEIVALMLTVLLGSIVASVALAQSDQDETASVAFTGEITKVNPKARQIHVQGANGEKGVFEIDAKQTTIMSGSQKVGIESLHAGEWIAIDADRAKGRKVATYIEVVEDPTGESDAGTPEATAAGATITVGHSRLEPALVQIAAGQSVTFHNVDEMPGGHTIVASDGSFSSPPLDEDQSWSHSFDVPGTYSVKIQQHPGATADIVVEQTD